MSIQQEGVLELLPIDDSGQVCLDLSDSPSLAIGMAKRGVHTYIDSCNKDAVSRIIMLAGLESVSNRISLCKEASNSLKFDFILLRQKSIDIDAVNKLCKRLRPGGTLVFNISNTKLSQIEDAVNALDFLNARVYLPFGDESGPAFVLPKEELAQYYYRYWSWKTFNVRFWLNKLVEYFFVFKLGQLWPVSNYIILLKK